MPKKLSSLMCEYFDSSSAHEELSTGMFGFNSADPCPIKPFQDKWSVIDNPKRLARDFVFYDFLEMKNFLNELIEYQEDAHHHAKIIVDHRTVRIEVNTRDLEEITELDKEYSGFVDMIFRDVGDYGKTV
jgi:pterin-4a-carbinolamine dehydratase